MRHSGVLCYLIMFSLLVLGTPAARADKRAARDHYKKGMAHFVMERWDEAIHEFDAGFTEEPQPEFLYNIAQAHRKAGRTAQAISFYKKYLSMLPERSPERRPVEVEMEAAREELASAPATPPSPPAPPVAPAPPTHLAPTVETPKPPAPPPTIENRTPTPNVVIERVAPPPALPPTVAPVATPTPPVPTTTFASNEIPPPRAPPETRAQTPSIEVKNGEVVPPSPVPTPTPTPAQPGRNASALRWVGVALIAGGAGLAVGGGLGFQHASQSASDQIVNEANQGQPYDPSLLDAMNRNHSLSIASYAGGGAMAVTGGILLIESFLVKARDDHKPAASIRPILTPGAAGLVLSGVF